MDSNSKKLFTLILFLVLIIKKEVFSAPGPPMRPSLPMNIGKVPKPRIQQTERYDKSVNDYLSQRTCWWNELCKEEFSSKFRCRCPSWSYCSSPGRYYNAYCTMSGAGYLWTQPKGQNSFFKKPYELRLSKGSPLNK